MQVFNFLLAVSVAAVIATNAHSAGPCDDFYARLPNVERALCEGASLQAPQLETDLPEATGEFDAPPEQQGTERHQVADTTARTA